MTQHILLIWSSVSDNVIFDRHKLQTANFNHRHLFKTISQITNTVFNLCVFVSSFSMFFVFLRHNYNFSFKFRTGSDQQHILGYFFKCTFLLK